MIYWKSSLTEKKKMARKQHCFGMYTRNHSFTCWLLCSGIWGLIWLILPLLSLAKSSNPSGTQGGTSNSSQKAK